MIARVARPAVVGAGIVFSPVRVRTPVLSRRQIQQRQRPFDQLSHDIKPAVIGAGIVFRPISICLAVQASLVNRIRRLAITNQPYLEESLADAVLGQPPVIITVILPRR